MTVDPFHGAPARAHLLLIEDASVLRELEVLALAGGGFAVTAMEHPGDALRHLQSRQTDAVVVNTDRATALQPSFIAALRFANQGVPILVLNAASSAVSTSEMEKHGASLVLDRPLHPTQLLVQVDAFLSGGLLPAAPKFADGLDSGLLRATEPALPGSRDGTMKPGLNQAMI